MRDAPVFHGRDHVRSDPILAEWIELTLAAGWSNVGGTRAPSRYRFVPPYDASPVVGDAVTTPPGRHSVEIELAITGGTAGTLIATLPFTLPYDISVVGHDDTGAFHVFTVKQSGEIMDGYA